MFVCRSVVIMAAVACATWLGVGRAAAQLEAPSAGGMFTRHHTQAQLLLSAASAQPGETIWAGVDLRMDPGWHTYWKNAGDAGTPTKIEWTLPPGISAGEIHWPVPQKLPPAEVTTYGYVNETVLLVPLTFASNQAPGSVSVAAKVSWLECQDVCIPADAEVTAKITVGPESQASPEAAKLAAWIDKTPRPDRPFSFQAWWEKTAADDTRPLIIAGLPAGPAAPAVERVDFFPDASDQFEVQSATEKVPAAAGFELRKIVKKFSGDWPRSLGGLIVVESNGQQAGFEFQSPIGAEAPAGQASATVSPGAASPAPPGLGQILLYAFLGGLILNLMPCVLPVIALKILGFVSEAHSEPGRVRKLGLVYALGVLVSFLVLAGIVISVKAAGHQAGWGMQYSSPVFVVCLTTLVLLVALNLFGVFEVTLSGRALDTAGSLASRSGAAGAFFNGVLATVLATPCTAPFLAYALGFAFQESAAVILLVFLTVGLGLAAPYVVLSGQPAWLKFLPRPGLWMQRFKIAMGFPMLATVVWLFNVAASSYGKNVLWLGVFLVLVAFAVWIFGEFVQRGRLHRGLGLAATLLVLLGAYALALEKELDWRVPMETNAGGSLKESAQGIDWQPWTPEAVAAARAAGKPVLVDFTADWCVTCQFNRKTSLEVSSVREKLKSVGAVALVGDYTHFPAAITEELKRHHAAGVPLVLVYPKDAAAEAIVLPSLLTPGIVLSALDRAR
jgi:thiol:disulfide interchange protein DsbD